MASGSSLVVDGQMFSMTVITWSRMWVWHWMSGKKEQNKTETTAKNHFGFITLLMFLSLLCLTALATIHAGNSLL